MSHTLKKSIKIALNNHSEFLQAWSALINLGYHCDKTPESAPYIFAYSDGHINYEFHDAEGVDVNNQDSAYSYFQNHANELISLQDLLNMASHIKTTDDSANHHLLKLERPLFEANYVKNGGKLLYLKWSECADGSGSYQVDWEAINEANISDSDFEEEISVLADHVTGCLMSWVECAKSKQIPYGFYLMPLQPSLSMLNEAEQEFSGLDIDDLHDRIVFSHQAMVNVLIREKHSKV